MTDYFAALKRGLEAAEATDRARKEIDEVFYDLNEQLAKETKEKIRIDRKEYETQKWNFASGSIFDLIKKETYWVLVAFNPSIAKSPVTKLANWFMDRAGYPCKIKLGDKVFICEDREALENSIAELLQDPLVGEKLYALMQLEETEQEDEFAREENETDTT